MAVSAARAEDGCLSEQMEQMFQMANSNGIGQLFPQSQCVNLVRISKAQGVSVPVIVSLNMHHRN